MKAEELMIGDWVFCEGQPIPSNATIEEIFDDGVIFKGEHYEGEASFDRIFPIPLTDEILRKNGFDINGIPEDMQPVEERDWSDDTYVWSRQETPDECIEVCVYMEDPNNFFAEIICQYCHVDGVHIKYVHELQHALRLCGIEKVVVL